MHEDDEKIKIDFSGLPKVVLMGNPNVGKSVIFNRLTGQYVTVSNYPGTTVEITRGIGIIGDKKVGVIDAPGLNSLIPSSEDEKVARDILLAENPAVILQVADAKNLRRTLLLTIQLIEMGIPLLLDLNMMDELKQRRITINMNKLSKLLSVEILPTVATEGQGVKELKRKLLTARGSDFKVHYGDEIENAVSKIALGRGPALMFLAGDRGIEKWVFEKYGRTFLDGAVKVRNTLRSKYGRSIDQVIGEVRNREISGIADQVLQAEPFSNGFLQWLGDITMRPLFGFPLLMFVLFLMYKFVGEFAAQTGVDFLENVVFTGFIAPWIAKTVKFMIPIEFIQEFLAGEYGILTMALRYSFAIILPILSAFFIFFSLLEDSGYLPRLAILLNRAFRLIGLSGRAVIPMVLGLGCDTMATMTTRTLETTKERIISTLLLALAIPCSAQLGVILGMIGSVGAKAAMIWLAAVIFIFLLVGFLSARIIPGSSSDFVLEIPPLRLPKLSNVVVKTLARIEWYLREAVPLIVLGTVILFFFDKANILKVIESFASPLVVNFLGLPSQAAEAFLIGFLRRDYGAAGLFALQRRGLLDPIQVVVSLVTITLFVPCIAQFLVMIKERGLKVALWITAFIFPFAFLVGGIMNFALRFFKVAL